MPNDYQSVIIRSKILNHNSTLVEDPHHSNPSRFLHHAHPLRYNFRHGRLSAPSLPKNKTGQHRSSPRLSLLGTGDVTRTTSHAPGNRRLSLGIPARQGLGTRTHSRGVLDSTTIHRIAPGWNNSVGLVDNSDSELGRGARDCHLPGCDAVPHRSELRENPFETEKLWRFRRRWYPISKTGAIPEFDNARSDSDDAISGKYIVLL